MTKPLVLPVFDLDGNQVGEQIRRPGKPPVYRPSGIKAKECAPYIGRIIDSDKLLVCEGPTDAKACMQLRRFDQWSILGCWSSTTIPPRSFWTDRFGKRLGLHSVVVGDNDQSGKDFNQRIANVFGSAYEVHWPPLFRHKGDARDYISEYGETAFYALVSRSFMRQPLCRNDEEKRKSTTKQFQDHAGIISSLVAQAGGQFCYNYGDKNEKWLCPLHNDVDDPSLTLRDSDGSWCCWAGCGQGGAAQFIMAWKGVSYKDALELMKLYV